VKNKITVAIPSYNNEKHIGEAIGSARMQEYPLKNILIIDDCSTDKTFNIAKEFMSDENIEVYKNESNLGIGKNLEKLMTKCETKYIVYLCADDIFTHPKVLTDIVHIFDYSPEIGVVGRYGFYFMDGHRGAIGVCRDKNILTSSCCPSGVAFRTRPDIAKSTNRIFVEMPTMVASFLKQYRWTMIEWDTVAFRYAPGINTGTKPSYYTESPTQNWIDLMGQNYQDFSIFITLKNRAPRLLLKEIWLHIENDKTVLKNPMFWLYGLTAFVLPAFILKRLTRFYRHRLSRMSAKIIERPSEQKH